MIAATFLSALSYKGTSGGGQGESWQGESCTHAFDYFGADASNVAFDDLSPRRAHNECTARFDRGKQRIALLKP